MTDTGSNPFAEPDFSAFQSPGAEDATDEGYGDEDVEDVEDELEDEDEFEEGEEFDDVDEVPVKAAAVIEHDGAERGRRGQPRRRRHSPLGARARRALHRGRP